MCAFFTSLTTTVFSQRSMWRFETVPHRTIPEGQQSSIFHRALIPPSDCLPTTRFLIRGAHEAAVHRLVTRATAGDQADLAGHRGISPEYDLVLGVHAELGMGGRQALQGLRHDVRRIVDELLHLCSLGQRPVAAVGRRRRSDTMWSRPVSYTHLRAHETPEHLVCRLLLE